ncbi:hypothetical protein [Streptomyces parvus]|uniref:hypothetical protein n=1 Tax=Streptomyces parvus TaxID=66428 RepID=UPI0033E6EA7A
MIEMLVIAALVGLAAGAAIAIVTLTLGFLVDWFRERAAQVKNDPDKVAVTVAEAIDSGEVSFIQGIFDTEDGKFSDVRRIKAENADGDVHRAHARHKVAIWE